MFELFLRIIVYDTLMLLTLCRLRKEFYGKNVFIKIVWYNKMFNINSIKIIWFHLEKIKVDFHMTSTCVKL